jgi:hypothetical protein
MTNTDKHALCDRVAQGVLSTKDVKRLGLPFEAFLRYAQMTVEQRETIAQGMRKHWGLS